MMPLRGWLPAVAGRELRPWRCGRNVPLALRSELLPFWHQRILWRQGRSGGIGLTSCVASGNRGRQEIEEALLHTHNAQDMETKLKDMKAAQVKNIKRVML